MFEQTKNVWQLREEDLPPPSFSFDLDEKPALGWKQVFKWKQLWLILFGLLAALLWVIVQAYVLDLGYTVTFKPDTLPKLSATKLTVVPAPIRYSLLQAPNEQQVAESPAIELSPPPVEPGMVPVNYTPPSLPPDLTMPPPPAEPSFKLVGIAQGADGTVATLKIQDDQSGIKDQIQDVREGSPVLDGYTVSKITADYVLIKQKTGKTIRVE